MTIDRFLIIFMAVVGLAVGIILIQWPQAQNFRIQPYFWVLFAMVLFELAAFARRRGAPGTMVTMEVRLFAFVLAILLMIFVPRPFGAAPG